MIIAKTFSCIEMEDGIGGADRFLLTDLTVRCDDARYRSARSFAVTMLFVFPIGEAGAIALTAAPPDPSPS